MRTLLILALVPVIMFAGTIPALAVPQHGASGGGPIFPGMGAATSPVRRQGVSTATSATAASLWASRATACRTGTGTTRIRATPPPTRTPIPARTPTDTRSTLRRDAR